MMPNVFRNRVGTTFSIFLLSAVFVFMTTATRAQSLSPFSAFSGLNSQQLVTLQVKLTYLGIQDKVLPSLGYSVTGAPFDLARFTPFYRPGVSYTNDTRIKTSLMSVAEAQAIITQVGKVSVVTSGGVAGNQFVSFSMSAVAGGQNKVFEAILDSAGALQLFASLRIALQTVPALVSTLSIMACPAGLSEPGIPLDVTSSTSVTFSGVRLDRATGQFVGTATVKNTGTSAIPGPVSFILSFTGNTSLANGIGRTCLVSPVGHGFINLPLTGSSFAAGEAIVLNLRYTNPDQIPIKPVAKVVAGPGSR